MAWLSLPEYSRRTGTPQSTVRLMIRAGRIEAHREARAPGDPRDVWKVWLDDPPEPAAAQPQDDPQPDAGLRVAPESDQPHAATSEPPAFMARLLDKLDERDATIASLHAELRVESAARAAAEARLAETTQAHIRQRDADAESIRALRAELERARRPWWRRLW